MNDEQIALVKTIRDKIVKVNASELKVAKQNLLDGNANPEDVLEGRTFYSRNSPDVQEGRLDPSTYAPIKSISKNGELIEPDENKNVNIEVNKYNIGLGNVDNTSDLDKPVSIPQQEEINKRVRKELKTNSENEYKVLSDNNFTDSEKKSLSELTIMKENYEFGKVDDIRVNDTSIVENKIAKIDLVTGFEDESETKFSSVKNTTLLNRNKVDKEPGKGLSKNDFTDLLKEKLEGLENYNDEELRNLINTLSNEVLHLNKEGTQNVTTNIALKGDLNIEGNIIQNGSAYETHAEKVFTKNDIIITRDGAVGGLANGEYTGILAKLYDGTNDGRLVFDNQGVARVGDVGDEQPIATREETPMNNGFAKWDESQSRFNTVPLSEEANAFAEAELQKGKNLFDFDRILYTHTGTKFDKKQRTVNANSGSTTTENFLVEFADLEIGGTYHLHFETTVPEAGYITFDNSSKRIDNDTTFTVTKEDLLGTVTFYGVKGTTSTVSEIIIEAGDKFTGYCSYFGNLLREGDTLSRYLKEQYLECKKNLFYTLPKRMSFTRNSYTTWTSASGFGNAESFDNIRLKNNRNDGSTLTIDTTAIDWGVFNAYTFATDDLGANFSIIMNGLEPDTEYTLSFYSDWLEDGIIFCNTEYRSTDSTYFKSITFTTSSAGKYEFVEGFVCEIPNATVMIRDIILEKGPVFTGYTYPVGRPLYILDLKRYENTVNKSLEKKVNIQDGKGLSTNDYTSEDKSKLDGIITEANIFAEEERQKSKNIFNPIYELGYYDISNGLPANSTDYKRTVQKLSIKPNTQYTFSTTVSNPAQVLLFYDASMNFISYTGMSGYKFYSFTTPSNAHYFTYYTQADVKADIQIEEGTVATDYQEWGGKILHEVDIEDFESLRTLPQEYQEVEYIESTGTQYIDTGYVSKYGDTVEIEFEYTTINNYYNFIYGATSPTNTDPVAKFGIKSSDTPVMEIVEATYVGNPLYVFDKKTYKMSLGSGNQKLYIDDVEVATGTQSGVIPNYNAFLFATNSGNNTYVEGNQSNGKLYKAIIKSGTTLVREFIPCYRKSDNKIGLYDIVNDVFYVNQGTGEFLKGENIYLSNVARRTDPQIQFAESERQKSKNLCQNTLENFVLSPQVYAISIYRKTRDVKYPLCLTINMRNWTYPLKPDNAFYQFNYTDGSVDYLAGTSTDQKNFEVTFSGEKDLAEIILVNWSQISGTIDYVQLEENKHFTGYQPYNGAIVHEKDIERVDVLYDIPKKETTLGGKDYGSGVYGGVSVTDPRFKIYKKIRYYAIFSNSSIGIGEIDLTYTGRYNSTSYYISNMYFGPETDTRDLYFIRVALTTDKSTLQILSVGYYATDGTWHDRASDTAGYKIYRLEGVY